MEYNQLSAIQSALLSGKLSMSNLVTSYLSNIEKSKFLNIYIDVYEDGILQQAKTLDEKIANKSSLGKCFGMVISVKDVISHRGHLLTGASKILEGFEAVYTATALQRLLDEDALVIGKVNCDQFGMGSSNENSVYGPTKNADDPDRTPGGSSGASAVSVQANTCLIALGSDTGGSVRQPAGFTGLFGLKPTYGRISRYGLIAYGSSFDQIGILGKNINDISLALSLMAGIDNMDPTSVDIPTPSFEEISKDHNGKKWKIAYLAEALTHQGLDPEIKSAQIQLMNELEQNGHSCAPVDFELLDYIVPTYYTLTTAEASTNLSRFDGIRYGLKVPRQEDLAKEITATRTAGFSEEVKKRIMLGSFVLSSGYYDAYYNKAQKIRRLLKDRVDQILDEYDFILMPISPIPAWRIGMKQSNPTEMYLADIFTVLANLVGTPAIAFPYGFHSNETKFGFQAISKSFSEEELLKFAITYE